MMLVHDEIIMQRIGWIGALTGRFLGLVTLISLILLGLTIHLVPVTKLSKIGGVTITPGFDWVMRAELQEFSRALDDAAL